MNSRLLLLVCTFILVLNFRSSNSAPPPIIPYSETFLSGLHRFSADFYETLASNKNESFVSSPISVLTILAMLAYGADVNTRDELVDVMQLPITQSNILLNFRQFLLNLKSVTDVELYLATKLFVQNQFEIDWIYEHVSDVIFQSEIESIDFQNRNQAAEIINTWTEEKTKNHITDIVTADDFDDSTRLVVVNAVYFKGSWVYAFETSERNRTFYLSEDNSVSIPMMCNEANYNHGFLLNFTVRYVELPYKSEDSNSNISMYILISQEPDGLETLAAHMDEVNFTELNAPKEKLEVCMPKYKIQTELDLIPILENMGIHDMFTDNANFSNIAPGQNLKVTKIIQKAFLSVDENGTEAAAATGAVVGLRSMRMSFIVNMPFISVIVVKDTGTPLFWAQINDPRSKLKEENNEKKNEAVLWNLLNRPRDDAKVKWKPDASINPFVSPCSNGSLVDRKSRIERRSNMNESEKIC